MSTTISGLTVCPISFLSQLRVLYLPWDDFTTLNSSVGCMSTTCSRADTMSTSTPRADTKSTATPPSDYTSTTPRSLKHLRSVKYCAISNIVSIIHPGVDYCTFYQLCVDYSFVSTNPYISIFWKCCELLKKSTMSMGCGLRKLGLCRPTQSYLIRVRGLQETAGGNLGHVSMMSSLLMARLVSSNVRYTSSQTTNMGIEGDVNSNNKIMACNGESNILYCFTAASQDST